MGYKRGKIGVKVGKCLGTCGFTLEGVEKISSNPYSGKELK
jgi:hypothetical protein